MPRNGSLSATLRACLENTVIIVERTSATKCTLLAGLLLCCTSAFAQSPDNVPKEVAVVELEAVLSEVSQRKSVSVQQSRSNLRRLKIG